MSVTVWQLDDSLSPLSELPRVVSASIERSATDDASLLESASVEFDAEDASWSGGWMRIDCDGEPLGCFRFEASNRSYDHGRVTIEADGYSVLKPAEEATAPAGCSLSAGEDAAAFAVRMLSVCPGRIEASGAAAMPKSIVIDTDASRLEAAWDALDAVGWRIRLTGTGGKVIEPLPTVPALRIDSTSAGVTRDGYEANDGELTYTRELGEGRPLDCVQVDLPQIGMSGLYRLREQDIELGKGATVSDTVGEGRS